MAIGKATRSQHMMWRKYFLGVYWTIVTTPLVLGVPKFFKLGGLFDNKDPCYDAFTASINAVNQLKSFNSDLEYTIFRADLYDVGNDLYNTERTVCHLFEKKAIAIFGPTEKKAAEHVQSICENVDMPNIVTRWDTAPARNGAFNFFPRAEILSKLFVRIVTEYQWKAYTILYDSSDSLVGMNELLKKWNPKGYTVTIRHLGNGTDFRDVLLAVRQSEVENIVIDCSYDILDTVLRQTQQVGLMSEHYKIFVTNLDLHTVDLEPYKYSGVNLTGLRLVDLEYSDPEGVLDGFLSDIGTNDMGHLRVQAALIYDAVHFFLKALKRAADVRDVEVEVLRCDGSDYWDYGTILSNYIRTVSKYLQSGRNTQRCNSGVTLTEIRGLTGLVKLNSYGSREDFELDIVGLHRDGLKRIGSFNSTQQFSIDWKKNETFETLAEKSDLYNKTFRVLIALVSPYNRLKKSIDTRSGNDRYEGFAIDIIHEISKLLHFNYTFIETDPDYGKMIDNATNKWSGMIGKIMNGEADLAITDLTITAERERVVDFTMPFMNLGISILYRKPTKAAPSLFSFLSPFSTNVWLYLMASYVFSSLLLFLIGRMSPKEWINPYPCIDEPQELQNQFTLKNSLWFMIGAIMQQGSEIAPMSHYVSLRLACGTRLSCESLNVRAIRPREAPTRPLWESVHAQLRCWHSTGKVPQAGRFGYGWRLAPFIRVGAFEIGAMLRFRSFTQFRTMTGGAIPEGYNAPIGENGVSTRMLAASWWFFCLIIVSSYTANLAAFLVVETNVKPIKSAEDLANLNGAIKYGAKKNGATSDFFKVNGYSTYEKMYKYMMENSDDVMTETNQQGVDKVRDINQNYAFLMESSSIHYITQRECNLTQIGGLLDAKGYGIAMVKNAPYRDSFNDAVLQLQESGMLWQLKQKWWEQKHGGGECKGEQPAVASKLTLDHVGGVFVVLGFGVAFSVPIAFWEFIWKIACIAYNKNISFKHEFVEEMKSVIEAKSSVKLARGGKQSSRIMNLSERDSTPGYIFSAAIVTSSETE